MNITINSRQWQWKNKEISYLQILQFTFGVRTGVTVTYQGKNVRGSMIDGDRILVEEGMIFNAIITNNA